MSSETSLDETTGSDIDLIRLLAREAMSVGWYSAGFFTSLIDADDDQLVPDTDARFMSVVSPVVVLGLLDRADSAWNAALTAVEEAVGELKADPVRFGEPSASYQAACYAVLSRIAALRKGA